MQYLYSLKRAVEENIGWYAPLVSARADLTAVDRADAGARLEDAGSSRNCGMFGGACEFRINGPFAVCRDARETIQAQPVGEFLQLPA